MQSAPDSMRAFSPETGVAPVRGRPAVRLWALKCLVLDFLTIGAGLGAAALGSGRAGLEPLPLVWALGFAAVAIALFALRGAYAWRLHLDVLDNARVVLTQVTVAAAALLALSALIDNYAFAADAMVRAWAFTAVFVVAGRSGLFLSQRSARRHLDLLRPTLIVGAGKVGRLVAHRLIEHPELGLRPVGYLDRDPLETDESLDPLPVLGASWDLDRVLAEYDIEQVILTFSTAPHHVLVGVIDRCIELGLDVAVVPRLFEKTSSKLTVEHVGGIPLMTLHNADPDGWYFRVKYLLDPVAAAILLILLLPVLLVVTVAVWISVGRPILFRQTRVGRDRQWFEILKFRTMRHVVSDEGAIALLPADLAPGGVEGPEDRRTRLGMFLRRTSIDELPQLVNVMRGEMSLVGPRPERPQFVERFDESVSQYGRRHRVKSGITGWAQVNGLRGRTSISDRAEWDNYYIENFSFWLDVKILLNTLGALAQADGRPE